MSLTISLFYNQKTNIYLVYVTIKATNLFITNENINKDQKK